MPLPPGWPRISSALYYDDANRAIDWLCHGFGFSVRLKVLCDNGRVKHAELTYAEGVIMVADENPRRPQQRAPHQVGGANTQNLMLYVDDVEAHCRQARAAGAVIITEPVTNDYGEAYWTDRSYECRDPGGHHWWFCQRLRNPKSTSG